MPKPYLHGDTPTLGVLAGWQVSGPTMDTLLEPLFQGIYAAARAHRCNLLLACGITSYASNFYPAWPELGDDSDFVPVGPWNTDGLIVVTSLASEARSRYIHQVMEDGHPVVFTGNGEGRPAVVTDGASGIRQAMAHLAAHGHRRIAFLAGPKDDPGDSLARLEAYQAALRQLNLETDPRLLAYGHHQIEGGRQAMQQLLAGQAPFTAVVCSNDESAYGAMQALHAAGRRIPEDVAVIGFDDRLRSAIETPPLTSVGYSLLETGQAAVDLLLRRLEGDATEKVQTPVRLVIRRSCGCVPGLTLNSEAQPPSTASHDWLAQTLLQELQAEPSNLTAEEMSGFCRQMVDALSLPEAAEQAFFGVLQQALQREEETGSNPRKWSEAISRLASELPRLAFSPGARLDSVLVQAENVINQSVERYYLRRQARQNELVQQRGLLNNRLLGVLEQAAVEDAAIVKVLETELPRLGMQSMKAFFFEGKPADPVAGCRTPDASRRFASRAFPPPSLYPAGQPFQLALMPLVMPEGPSGFVAFEASDLAEGADVLRSLVSALHSARLYRAAAEGRRMAEEANQLKSRFLASVSHELRTPLNLIVGLSEMLLDKPGQGSTPEAYRKDVAQIHSSAQHLGWLIRDVLDLASSQAGQLRLTNGPVDMTQVLAVVSAAGEQLAREKGLAWEAEIPPGLPTLWGDQTRLTQVGLNLVSNAVKFTEAGKVSLRAWVEQGRLTVEVSDTGLGIPNREQLLIFNEFRQSERTSQRGYGGLGLGLAICKRLVDLHGGEIGVRSSGEERSGSMFYFRLPVPEAASAGIQEPRRAVVGVETPEQGEQLRAYLEREGYTVEVCLADENGEWLADVIAKAPQAVVLDAGVAARQGWEVLKALKSNPQTQSTPVLFYSLHGESGSMLALDYLSKPLSPQALTAALELQGLAATDETAKTVLVVDDEPGILEMHMRVVAGLGKGYQVLKARNGREALEIIREARPDLVLLDLMMPEMNGFGVLEAMRAGETTRDIPVIVLTAQVLTESDMARLNRGVATVLEKGVFSAAETLEHVRSALARGRKTSRETQRLVRKAMAYIHEHYTEEISRESIARHVGISKDYLTECFNEEIKIPPMIYLARYRVNKAKLLLSDGDKSITKVAQEVGFNRSTYFAQVFQKEIGVSPSAYRRGERPGQ